MSDLNSAMIDWNAEVESETARLIRLGVPPWDAAIQARQRVTKKRREAASADPKERT